MAGNFWKSSHCEQWILDPADLIREREDLKVFTEEEYQKVMIFFTNFIIEIGKDPNLDKNPIHMQDVDPFLLAPTCILLAAKVEESGILQPNKLINATNNALKSKWPQLESFLLDVRWPSLKYSDQSTSNLLTTLIKPQLLQETEFYILEILDCSLVVYHPYRALTQLLKDFKNCTEIAPKNCTDRLDPNDNLCGSLYADAWRVCNDSLRSDCPLLYPPHLIAIAAIMIAATTTNKDNDLKIKNWLAELNLDYEKVYEVQQMLFNMYKLWKEFDEQKQLKPLLIKLPKPQ